jgi:hypothetical protein
MTERIVGPAVVLDDEDNELVNKNEGNDSPNTE